MKEQARICKEKQDKKRRKGQEKKGKKDKDGQGKDIIGKARREKKNESKIIYRK